MFTFYESKTGDTYATVSRKVYGTEEHENLIREANEGYAEPFIAGYALTIPPLQGVQKDLPQKITADNQDEVAIIINGVRFRFWSQVRIRKTLDSIDTVDFVAPFNHEIKAYRDALKPLSYASVVVALGGFPIFTGTMVVVDPKVDTDGKRMVVSCYSLPGVLNDCTPPASSYPLNEFTGFRFNQIADKMISTFGINMVYESDVGAVFTEPVSCGTETKIMWFLNDLAKQRNGVITNNAAGDLVFKQSSKSNVVVAKLQQGLSPLVSIKPQFNPQKYYSQVTGVDPIVIELGGSIVLEDVKQGGKYTVKNPHLKGVHRPFTFRATDGMGANIVKTVDNRIARMFANSASYEVTVSTWRDNKGNLWEPDTFITVISPDAMIYKEYRFIIRSVVFSETSKSKVATMTLVLPGAFSAEMPEVLPWGD